MSKRIASCPQCASTDIITNTYQVRCRACGWSIQDPDPRYVAHSAELEPEDITYTEPIAEAIDALPADFAASLTTTRNFGCSASTSGSVLNGSPTDSVSR